MWKNSVGPVPFSKIALAVCMVAFGSCAARADTLAFGSSAVFSFGGVGSPAVGNPWTFTGAGVVTVLDGFLNGDQFSVYDGTTFLGITSTPVNNGASCGANFAACFANSAFSRGNYAVGAGAHSIYIYAAMSPYGSGNALIGLGLEKADPPVTAAVPEPGSLVLFATGLAGVAGAMRRRFRR